MATLEIYRESTKEIDENGQEKTTIVEKTTERAKLDEPDYVKLYTKMWCEFNAIPMAYRELFLELVTRMTYCNSATQAELQNSQLVSTGKPFGEQIMAALHWKSRDSLQKGLKALCECNAIRKINRGVYQINPQYAGRGQWRYNPRLSQGGLEDLVAVFSFKDRKVDANFVWADDGQPTEYNRMWREGMKVRAGEASVKTRVLEAPEQAPEAPIENYQGVV